MSFRSQTSRKGSGRQFSKNTHEKKAKEKKKRTGAKYLQEESPEVSSKDVIEKTVTGLNRLGNQVFALSPFSQYFDDWLLNLRQVVSEFESHPAITIDDQFRKEKEQIFLDVQGAMAENRLSELNLTLEAKALADNNHLIADADKEYAEKTRELSNKRNSEISRLSSRVNQVEEEIDALKSVKFKFYQISEKKRNQEKLEQAQKELAKAKNELEVTMQNFTAEQEKMHDNYEKRKQELTETSERLHKELEKLETDTSVTARRTACDALIEAIQRLITRNPLPN